MLALSAPYSLHPSLQQHVSNQPSSSSSTPGARRLRANWKIGIRFAEAAFTELFRRDENTNAAIDDKAEIDLSQFPGQELEVAQTIVLLNLRDVISRLRDKSARLWFRHAVKIISQLTLKNWGTQDMCFSNSSLSSNLSLETSRGAEISVSTDDATLKTTWIRNECLRRMIWITKWAMMHASSATLGHPMKEDPHNRMPLPIDEGIFDLSIMEAIMPGNSSLLFLSWPTA